MPATPGPVPAPATGPTPPFSPTLVVTAMPSGPANEDAAAAESPPLLLLLLLLLLFEKEGAVEEGGSPDEGWARGMGIGALSSPADMPRAVATRLGPACSTAEAEPDSARVLRSASDWTELAAESVATVVAAVGEVWYGAPAPSGDRTLSPVCTRSWPSLSSSVDVAPTVPAPTPPPPARELGREGTLGTRSGRATTTDPYWDVGAGPCAGSGVCTPGFDAAARRRRLTTAWGVAESCGATAGTLPSRTFRLAGGSS